MTKENLHALWPLSHILIGDGKKEKRRPRGRAEVSRPGKAEGCHGAVLPQVAELEILLDI